MRQLIDHTQFSGKTKTKYKTEINSFVQTTTSCIQANTQAHVVLLSIFCWLATILFFFFKILSGRDLHWIELLFPEAIAF
jgi:hypothetical protein